MIVYVLFSLTFVFSLFSVILSGFAIHFSYKTRVRQVALAELEDMVIQKLPSMTSNEKEELDKIEKAFHDFNGE